MQVKKQLPKEIAWKIFDNEIIFVFIQYTNYDDASNQFVYVKLLTYSFLVAIEHFKVNQD